MLAGIRECRESIRRHLVGICLAALIALLAATTPVFVDGALETSVVPAASACCGQSGGGG